MSKPVVRYDSSQTHRIKVGEYAYVVPIDHPSNKVSNFQHVLTSEVVSYDEETGVFETENTIYRPITP